MNTTAWIEIGVFFAVLLGLVKPLGWYMARVYEGGWCGLDSVFGPVERVIYRLSGIKPQEEMTWQTYATTTLVFNALGLIVVYVVQRWQGWLPLNPQQLPAVAPDLAFNTAVSFATNTNWQAYSGGKHVKLLYSDGWSDSAELPVRRDRHGGPRCARPRINSTRGGNDREFLGRSHARNCLHPDAIVVSSRHFAGVAGGCSILLSGG